MQRNILLIDNRVENYEAIAASVRTDTTKCVVFDVMEMALDEDETSSFSIIMAMIDAEIGNGNKSIDNIGLVQHNYDRAAYYQMFGNRCKRAPIIGVEEIDPALVEWGEVGSFLSSLKTLYGVQHFDMMACAIYSDPDWKYIIDNLSEQVGIEIRASTDVTGSLVRGGNWFLESHTGVDLKTVYFTESIETYNGTLFTNNSTNKYKLGVNTTIMDGAYTASWSVLSIPTIPSDPSRPTIPSSPPSLSGDGININGMWGFPNASTYLVIPPVIELSNIIQVVSTQYGFATLNKYGAVGVYGYGANYSVFTSSTLNLTPSGASISSGVVRIYSNPEFYCALKSDGSIVSWGGWYSWTSSIDNRYPTNFTITSGSNIVKVLVSPGVMFAITSAGTLVGWPTGSGAPDYSTLYPSSASLSSGVVEVYSNWGNAHLALKSDGSIVTFGGLFGGASAGDNHVGVTFNAITAGRTSWAGINASGGIVLINNTQEPIYNPYSVSLTSGWVKIIEVNAWYFCALRNDGAVVTWRDPYASNQYAGNPSDNPYATRYPSGINMGSGSGIVNIYDLGIVGFAALTSSGQLIRWGGYIGYSNNLYSGTSSTSVTSGVVDVCSAGGTAVALKSDGSVFIWGRDLPTGGTAFTPQNPNLGSGSGIVRIFSSNSSQLAFLKSDKTMIYWSKLATGRTIANNYLGGSSISSVDTVFYSEDGFMSVGGPAPIVPTITWVSIPGKTYGDGSFNLTDPSSNSSTAFSYSSGTLSVATISGSTVTILSGGSSVITATQPVNGTTYWDGTITTTLTVALATSDLSASTFSVPATKIYGDASFNNFTRPTSNNSAGAITYASNNTGVATIDTSGNWITLVSAGDVSFNAIQAATAQYASATKTSTVLTVLIGTPTLSASTFSVPATKIYGDASFNNFTRPTSNSAGAITYTSSNPGVATIDVSGNTITLVSPGDVSFNATQSAVTGRFTSATKASNTLSISKGAPVYQPISQVSKTFGIDASFSLSAIMVGASTSNGAYTFSLPGATTVLSTNNLNNVTGANFTTGGQYQSNLKVAWGGTLAGWDKSGGNAVHLIDISNVYGSSTNTPNYVIMFWVDNVITQTTAVSNSNVIGSQYTVNFKAGPAVYDISTQATQATASDGIVFEILRANNTVLATNTYLPGAWAGFPTLTQSSFTYTGDGSGDVRIRIRTVSTTTGRFAGCVDDVVISSSTPTPYISISGDVATVLEYTPSAITIAAAQSLTTNYNAGSTTFSLLVSIGTPTLSANTFAVPATKVYGDASFNNFTRPTSNSTGAITYSSSNPGVATIDTSGNWITILSAGDVSFNATQAAVAGQFTSATKTSNTLAVALATSDLSASTFAVPATKTYGDVSFNVTTFPTSNGNGAITYSSSNPSVATIEASAAPAPKVIIYSGNNYTGSSLELDPGDYSDAWLAPRGFNDNIRSIIIPQGITVKVWADNYNATFIGSGDATYTSDISVATVASISSLRITGSSSPICRITIVSAGDVSFNATQAATAQYAGATKTSNTLIVALATPTLSTSTFSVAASKLYGDASFNNFTRPTSNSTGAIAYSSSNPSVATIDASGNWITIVSAGDVSFNATQAAVAGQFTSAIKTSNTLTVSPLPTPTLSASTFSVAASKTYGNAPFNVTTLPTSNSSGAITYSSSNAGVATIDTSAAPAKVIIYSGINYTGSSLELDTGDYSDAWLAPLGFNDNINSIIIPQGFSVKVWRDNFDSPTGDATYTSNRSVTTVTSISSLRITGSAPPICRITIVGAGDVSFTASQAIVTGQFMSATKTSNVLTVALATSTLSASTFSVAASKMYGDASFNNFTRPTSNSSSTIIYSSSNTGVATIDASGNWITLVGAGDVSFNATQAATSQYASATKTSTTLTVSLGVSTFAANAFAVDTPKAYGDASFNITTLPSGNSLGAITYETDMTYAVFSQIGADIDGEAANDSSGTVSVSADGYIVAIGATGNDGNGSNSGHVRVYAWNSETSTWVKRGADIDGEMAGENSGFTVSLSADGSILAIGAPYYAYLGTVRVYEWNSVSLAWDQRGANIDGEFEFDQSGWSTSLSANGTVVAIGATGNDDNGDFSGQVRVYTWNSGTLAWEQRGAGIDGEAVSDYSGQSVSLSADGTIVAIGATGNDGTGNVSGHVRVYSWNSGTLVWDQRGADIDGEAANDDSGQSVSLSADGTIVAIGAFGNTGVNGSMSGHVRVYSWNSGTLQWVQRGADIDGEAADDRSGGSISLSSNGNVLAIGAVNNDGTGGISTNNRGHVRIYAWNSGSSAWVQRGTDIDGEAAGDGSGTRVSISSNGTIVAIGARLNSNVNGRSGHVRVYSIPADGPSTVASIHPTTGLITLLGTGTATFTATQAATNQYPSATKTSNTLTVSIGTPTLSASTFSVPATKVYGDASFNNFTRPTSNSSGAITYSSSNTSVATIDTSGNWITILSAGDVSFNATQAAVTGQFTGATKTSTILAVALGTSNLSASTFSVPATKVYGDSSFNNFTRPTSNGNGAITYASSNISVATIDASGNWITIVGTGDVSFNATQAATAQYASATKASNALAVSKATPTLAFVSPPTTKNITDASFVVVATSASPGAVTYASSNTAYATVGSTTGRVTLVGAGTVTITANQVSATNYNAPTTNASYSIVISTAGTALEGQSVSSGTSFANLNLAGASLAGTTLSGVSFSGATLTGADLSGAVITGTDFTNANLSGATNLPTFSTAQKLQLLRNINNVAIGAVQISAPVTGADISALISISTPVPGLASTTFTIKAPTAVDASSNKLITVSTGDVSNNKSIYIPLNTGENVKINGTVFSFNGVNLMDASGNVRSYLTIAGAPFKIYAGSIIGLNLSSIMNQVSFTAAHTGLYDILAELYVLK